MTTTASIIQSLIGLYKGRLEEIKIFDKQGLESVTYQGLFDGADVIIKITHGRNSYPLEKWLYEKLTSLEIPVPKVIDYQLSLPDINLPCLIIEKLSGKSLVDVNPIEDRLKYLPQLASIHSKIHTIHFDGYGFLQESTEGFKASISNWREFLDWGYHFNDLINYVALNQLLETNATHSLTKGYEKIASSDRQGTLVYNDLYGDHVFVNENSVVGLIDPGNAFAGIPEYDLGYTFAFQTREERELYQSSYLAAMDWNLVYDCMNFVCLYKGVAAHKGGNLHKARQRFASII
jgi:aminoglycoside phosphotransferase (APT) family kinase protein